MAKMTRKMGMGKHMSEDDEMDDEEDEDESEDESEKTPKRRVKKVTVEETYAKGGMVRAKNGCVMAGRGGKYKGMM
jgi:hypothetical protein